MNIGEIEYYIIIVHLKQEMKLRHSGVHSLDEQRPTGRNTCNVRWNSSVTEFNIHEIQFHFIFSSNQLEHLLNKYQWNWKWKSRNWNGVEYDYYHHVLPPRPPTRFRHLVHHCHQGQEVVAVTTIMEEEEGGRDGNGWFHSIWIRISSPCWFSRYYSPVGFSPRWKETVR